MHILHNYPLNLLNTLALNAIAKYFVVLDNIVLLPTIAKYIRVNKIKYFVLGGGSNVILPAYYEGLVVYNKLEGIELVNIHEQNVQIRVMSGVNWDYLVEYTLANNWYGLENLSLIPGTVGAAPVQNIGAYGVEVSSLIVYVEAYDILSQSFKKIIDCNFSYRNSIFKTKPHYIIISVVFNLSTQIQLNFSYTDTHKILLKNDSPSALDMRNYIIKIRRDKLPDVKHLANVGSFFHNPVLNYDLVNKLKLSCPDLPTYLVPNNNSVLKISAGWLIDRIGLKGYRSGDIGTYYKQALVVVNYSINTTQLEILNFAQTIQNKVFSAYSVNLNIEPIIIS